MIAMQAPRLFSWPADRTQIAALWPHVFGFVTEALKYGQGRFTVESIRERLGAGRARLWVVQRDRDTIAAVVTVNSDFPAKRVCTILLCGGADLDEWMGDTLHKVEAAARAEGCAQNEIIGRPGWERKCPGYDKAGVWLVKELS